MARTRKNSHGFNNLNNCISPGKGEKEREEVLEKKEGLRKPPFLFVACIAPLCLISRGAGKKKKGVQGKGCVCTGAEITLFPITTLFNNAGIGERKKDEDGSLSLY